MVAYNIADDCRLGDVATLLSRYGSRIQLDDRAAR
jgi:hypothetical protein